MKNVILAVFFAFLVPALLLSDAGILIPHDKAQPDPAVLSLEEMEISIHIDNGDARVFVRQIFSNHTPGIEEGNYVFALPGAATVSDFAVWDGPTRIPAVVLERKRAEEIYTQLQQQAIDPGLLQMGERGNEEAQRSAVFSARIVPIPPFGTKRLEFEYHQPVAVENLKSYFAIPLRPDAYQSQTAGRLRINLEMRSAQGIQNFKMPALAFPMQIDESNAHLVRSHFEAQNVKLGEDFIITYDLARAESDSLQVFTYRNPDEPRPSPVDTAPSPKADPPGFFEAQALFGFGKSVSPDNNPGAASGPLRTIIALFDASLSMQWEKLERSFKALETLLRTLRPADRFNVILFNSQTQLFQASPVAGDAANIQRTLDFVRSSRLRGGTDMERALSEGLDQCSSAGTNYYLVLFSDGGATRGSIQNGKLAAWYSGAWKKLADAQRPRTYIFGVGDDANLPLLTLLARQDGVLEHVLSTEPIDFKLDAFLSKIGRSPVDHLSLTANPGAAVDLVYPLQETVFSGSRAAWVGRYSSAQANVGFTAHGVRDGAAVDFSARANLPAQSLEHQQLPRLWARARVDSLLEKIARDGEDQATIDEIIRLARQYKFVTPYTSFLAAPRALLRPRVIRPGDPVLRVRTDESIVSVTALFPFGLVQKLRYLSAEDIWQTRFLAPDDMQDGTYSVRLVLRDRQNHTYRESKTFVIASKPPLVRIKLDGNRFHRGQTLDVRASASQMTRTLIARLEGAAPVELKWNARAGTNTGPLSIPEQMIPGTYKLTVTAEDIAHNIGTQEVRIEVLP